MWVGCKEGFCRMRVISRKFNFSLNGNFMLCHDFPSLLTEILKVNSNLMHATGERFTENNTRLAIKSKLLESRCAIFAFWWYFTHSNFIAYNFDRFLAFQYAPREIKWESKRNFKKSFLDGMVRNWKTYSGNSPSTRQMYCFCTCRFLIWCSICLAFFGLLPNNNKPDVNRSNRWIVRKFFKLYSLARIKTTVLWRYRPHGWTWNIFQVLKVNFLSGTKKFTLLNNKKKSSLRNKKRSNLFVKKLFFHQKKKWSSKWWVFQLFYYV